MIMSAIAQRGPFHCQALCGIINFSLPVPVAADQVTVRVVLTITAVLLLVCAVWSLKRQF
jgi:hypothetical protein